jgi:nitrogen fixation NifU-like protein
MTDQLYQAAILDLARRAKGSHRLAAPDASVTLDNPLCGDRVTLDLAMADGLVAAVGHEVKGCLLCQAAAAVIAARAPGASASALRVQAATLETALAAGPEALAPLWPELAAFAPVQRHKSRRLCVLLPFRALARVLPAD